jgi:hypothetical protein
MSMPRRIRSKQDRRQAAWEQRLREEEVEDLLDVLRSEWSQHLATLAADSDPQDVADGQITPEYHLQHV